MPTIRKGSARDAVKKWQKFLKSKNYDIGKCGADGDFGGDTDAATRKFQKAKKPEVNGVVGKNTWAAAGG